MSIEKRVAAKLIKSGQTLAIAESCTGGLLSNRLTNIPGSSKFLLWAAVAYSNESKTKVLKVPIKTLKRFGAVSTQTAVAMAMGVRKTLHADFGIGITGIAGPSGGTRSNPVGTTYIAVSSSQETLCLDCRFQGTRSRIKSQATTQALRLLDQFLL